MFIRLGPMNGQVQVHRALNEAPCRRGIWAFPYPFHDAFFYCHVWNKYLPKALTPPKYPKSDEPNFEELLAQYNQVYDVFDWDAHNEKMKEIRKTHHPKQFWHGGGFYSYIKPSPNETDRLWYWYDNPRDYVRVARKHIIADYRHGLTYSSDHFQVFIPC